MGFAAFFVLNGYLLGREYFELAAMRHLRFPQAVEARRQRSFDVFIAGMIVAVFVTVPLPNLFTPLFATAFMTRIMKRLAWLKTCRYAPGTVSSARRRRRSPCGSTDNPGGSDRAERTQSHRPGASLVMGEAREDFGRQKSLNRGGVDSALTCWYADRVLPTYLTTAGRVTGQPRQIEIWFTEHGGRFYLIADRESANWVRNIQSQPQVKVRVGDAKINAFARVVRGDREPQLAATVKALFFAKYGWGDGLMVEITPA